METFSATYSVVKIPKIRTPKQIAVIIQKMSCLMTKPTKWHVRPAKTQISLGIHPVWSESSLSTWRKLGSLATHWGHSEDSDQTGWMPRLIWVFAGHTDHFVGFVTRQLIYIFRSKCQLPQLYVCKSYIAIFTVLIITDMFHEICWFFNI